MEAMLYSPSQHKQILLNWFEQWKIPPVAYDTLPDTGLMVAKDGVYLCALFLYHTNSTRCYIENLISNKEASDEDRRAAINLVFETMYEVVKAFGYKETLSYSRFPEVINRARETMGCSVSEHVYHSIKRSI
jgi:hypothetical protein